MAYVLRDYAAAVRATDIESWGGATDGLVDFLAPADHPPVDWIITNPPFALALDFALTALNRATLGVALLVRLGWAEGQERAERLFSRHRPALLAIYEERVPMVVGAWDPDGTTATAYAWFVWRVAGANQTEAVWIPRSRDRLSRDEDIRQFAPEHWRARQAELFGAAHDRAAPRLHAETRSSTRRCGWAGVPAAGLSPSRRLFDHDGVALLRAAARAPAAAPGLSAPGHGWAVRPLVSVVGER